MSRRHELRTLLRGALRPPENDSAFLLDVHRRAVPQERMARYDDSFSVDLVIVGAGAGGGTLAQRLARRGWKVVARAILSAFYSHPWAWNEIGFGGPAYPRGYARMGAGQRESWEGAPAFERDPVKDTEQRGVQGT